MPRPFFVPVWTFLAFATLFGLVTAVAPSAPGDLSRLVLESFHYKHDLVHSLRFSYLKTETLSKSKADLRGLRTGEVLREQGSLVGSGDKFRWEFQQFSIPEGLAASPGEPLERPLVSEVHAWNQDRYSSYSLLRTAGSIASTVPDGIWGGIWNLIYPCRNGDILRLLEDNKDNLVAEPVRDSSGQTTVQVSFQTATSQYEMVVSPEIGYQCMSLLVKIPWDEDQARSRGGPGHTLIECHYGGYVLLDGVWMPQNVDRVASYCFDDGRKEEDVRSTIALNGVVVNGPVEPSEFTIQFPPDTHVTIYDVGVTIGDKGEDALEGLENESWTELVPRALPRREIDNLHGQSPSNGSPQPQERGPTSTGDGFLWGLGKKGIGLVLVGCGLFATILVFRARTRKRQGTS